MGHVTARNAAVLNRRSYSLSSGLLMWQYSPHSQHIHTSSLVYHIKLCKILFITILRSLKHIKIFGSMTKSWLLWSKNHYSKLKSTTVVHYELYFRPYLIILLYLITFSEWGLSKTQDSMYVRRYNRNAKKCMQNIMMSNYPPRTSWQRRWVVMKRWSSGMCSSMKW